MRPGVCGWRSLRWHQYAAWLSLTLACAAESASMPVVVSLSELFQGDVGRGNGLGRGLGVGVDLGVAVGVGVGVPEGD